MSIAVVVNPRKAGDPGRARSLVDARALALGDPPPAWFETTADDPGPGQARRAMREGASTVIAWGGDGTVTGVASALALTDVALGIIPGGTGNLLARNLGIPLDLPDAIDTALRGDDRRIDVLDVYLGKGQRRIGTVMCGTGWDADMMAAPEGLKRALGWGAYVVQGARRVRQQPMRLRMSVDGGPEQHVYGRTVLIANLGTLVAGLELMPEAVPDDGLLEVLVIDPSSPLDWLRTTAGIVRGKGSAGDPSRTLLRGRQVVVTTGHARRRQVDGDLVEDGFGFNVTVLPRALAVRVPAPI
ncbi:MAG: diacylglycerol/lipid kinase family protein [Candidatus Nanopelagicales bacterium]